MNSPAPNDELWFFSDEAKTHLLQIEQWNNERVALTTQVKRLRKNLPPSVVGQLLEIGEYRSRGRKKFRLSSEMLFTKRGYEQATDEWISRYKAVRFAGKGRIADLCCGIGGDAIGLGMAINKGLLSELMLVDADPLMVGFARHNVAAYTSSSTAVSNSRIEDLDCSSFDTWHLDPDRRKENRRSVRLENFAPGLEVIQELLEKRPSGSIKLAPISVLPYEWLEQSEREWIGRDGETKQQVVWFGDLTKQPGTRRVTVINEVSPEQTASMNFPNSPDDEFESIADSLDDFIFEAHSTVLAGQVLGQLAAELGLARLAPDHTLLTGSQPHNSPFITCFRVVDVFPLQQKRLNSWLSSQAIYQLEFKWNGVRSDEYKLNPKKTEGSGDTRTLFMTRMGKQRVVIVTQRASS